jgi:hypothetical protein
MKKHPEDTPTAARPSDDVPFCVGVDPGETGAIAYRHGAVRGVRNMPGSDIELIQLFRELRDMAGASQLLVMLEDVGQHMLGNNAASAASLLASKRACSVAALSVGALVDLASPRQWQPAYMGPVALPANTKSPDRNATLEETKAWKKAKATRRHVLKHRIADRTRCLFPGERVVLDTADAWALLWYCERYHKHHPAARPTPKHLGLTPKQPKAAKVKTTKKPTKTSKQLGNALSLSAF